MITDIEQIKNEMRENVAMQEYFKKFTESSVTSFINSYALDKSIWIENGKRLVENKVDNSIQWITEATKHLGFIQQKKLFDTQCLWRADKLKIKEVEICYDFIMWGSNILNCPFIDPVSEDDINLYIQYLQSDNVDTEEEYLFRRDYWQDYNEMIGIENYEVDGQYLPEWYEFENMSTGKSGYMVLPNIRGEKEEFYCDLSRKKSFADNNLTNANDIDIFKMPADYLFYSDKENTDCFVNTFESKEIKEWYKAYEWNNRNTELKDEIDYSLSVLYDADEPVPIDANENWAEGIQKAAQKYTHKKIIESLPIAWEQYMMNIEMQIAFPMENVRKDPYRVRNVFVDMILEGRELNDEPIDLNF